jgi:hypothetical protein
MFATLRSSILARKHRITLRQGPLHTLRRHPGSYFTLLSHLLARCYGVFTTVSDTEHAARNIAVTDALGGGRYERWILWTCDALFNAQAASHVTPTDRRGLVKLRSRQEGASQKPESYRGGRDGPAGNEWSNEPEADEWQHEEEHHAAWEYEQWSLVASASEQELLEGDEQESKSPRLDSHPPRMAVVCEYTRNIRDEPATDYDRFTNMRYRVKFYTSPSASSPSSSTAPARRHSRYITSSSPC